MQWPPDITTNPSNTTVHLKRGCTNTPTSPGNRTPPLSTMNKRQTDKRRIVSRRCLVRLTLLNDNSTKPTIKTQKTTGQTKTSTTQHKGEKRPIKGRPSTDSSKAKTLVHPRKTARARKRNTKREPKYEQPKHHYVAKPPHHEHPTDEQNNDDDGQTGHDGKTKGD